MNSHHRITTPLFLASAIGLLASSVHAAQAQQAPELKLTYDNGASTCLFHTDNGVRVSGSLPQTIEASGYFDSSCNIGGGGNTGAASVSVTAAQPTINVGDTTSISWAINGDVCRYDGSSLPEAVLGWKTTGYACTTDATCTGGNLTHTFNTAGVYTFRMTCNSGVNDSKSDTATITVGVPPGQSCVAPTGLTRDTTGIISNSGGQNSETVNVQYWKNVYGHRRDHPTITVGWPGYLNRDVKVNIQKNHYWALEFTVPAGYPTYSSSWNGSGPGPYGTWNSNGTLATENVLWTLSISPKCGDFDPNSGNASAKCYQQYTTTQAGGLLWTVTANGQPPFGSACPLQPGKTYYLNIIPSPLGDPLNSSGNGCNQTMCKNNFLSNGNFAGSQNPPQPN